MEAGRALDALVAEKVMGFKIAPGPGNEYGIVINITELRRIPKYSTDIAAAFEALKRLEELGWIASIRSQYDVMNGWIVRQVSLFLPGEREVVSHFHDLGVLPQAICLAAINAVGALKKATQCE